MATILQGNQDRLLNYGQLITFSWTLPGSATTNTLFTATGGLVIVTSLVGQVTTVIGSTATSVALGLGTPGVGGTLDTDGIAASTVVTSAEVGCLFTPQASSGLAGALNAVALAGSAVYQPVPFVINSATITATTTANAGGGVINWYLTYLPLDNGAYVHT